MTKYNPSPEEWAQARADILVLANTKYPTEACGFILMNDPQLRPDTGLHVVSVDNVAEWPYAQYRIKPEDTAWALRTGRCIGVWHSHPSDPAVPSELDAELAAPDIFNVIYAVQDEDLAVFLVEDGQLAPQTFVMPGAEPDVLTVEVRP